MSSLSHIDLQEYTRRQTECKSHKERDYNHLLTVVETNTVQIPNLRPVNVFGDYV